MKKEYQKVIAVDISQNSLEKAIDFIKLRNLDKYIDIRLGDGLEVIKPFEVDTLVIAGMGGLLIRDILDKDWDKRDSITHFILQPNIASEALRKYLYDNNFEIIDEKLVMEDRKFYEIIYAKKGKDHIEDKIYYEIGEKLIVNGDPLLKDFINHKIKTINSILEELEYKTTEKSKSRYDDLMEKRKRLKAVLKKVESN